MAKKIWKYIFNVLFLLYGFVGILGIGPITSKAILSTYVVIFFAAVCGWMKIEPEEE